MESIQEKKVMKMSYVSGKMIKELREKKNMTQKELAEKLLVSDKTISKWETEKGLPDISFIGQLASILGVSIAELFAGEYVINTNKSGNMKKVCFYVCPICGNVIVSTGEGNFNCCGVTLVKAEVEEDNSSHVIECETIENDYYVQINHPMEKDHYISFAAFITTDTVTMVKMYPEQNARCRFTKNGHGYIIIYCNRHGLFSIRV